MDTTTTFTALVVEKREERHYERNVKPRTLTDLPEGDLLVRVRYSSLNYKDALSPATTRQ